MHTKFWFGSLKRTDHMADLDSSGSGRVQFFTLVRKEINLSSSIKGG
jgi:hypothetical protein